MFLARGAPIQSYATGGEPGLCRPRGEGWAGSLQTQGWGVGRFSADQSHKGSHVLGLQILPPLLSFISALRPHPSPHPAMGARTKSRKKITVAKMFSIRLGLSTNIRHTNIRTLGSPFRCIKVLHSGLFQHTLYLRHYNWPWDDLSLIYWSVSNCFILFSSSQEKRKAVCVQMSSVPTAYAVVSRRNFGLFDNIHC